jgi:hypothetical protein
LSYNNLAQIAHTVFSPQFGVLGSNLESLFAVEIGLDPESWAYLKTQLPQNLFELDLSQNNCVTFDLGSDLPNLQTLSLANCPHLTQNATQGYPILKRLEIQGSLKASDSTDFLKNNESLEYLDLSNCERTSETLALLFQSQCFPYLEFLILKKNLIRALPLKDQNLKSLHFIDLRENNINSSFQRNHYYKNRVVLAYESKPKTKKTADQDLNTIWEMGKNN